MVDSFELRTKIKTLVKAGSTFAIKNPKIELIRPDDIKTSWIWMCQIVIRSNNTQHEAIGLGSSPYMDGLEVDKIGYLKALQKAEMSAYDQHIQKEFRVDEEKMKKDPPTEKQLIALKKMGYDGDVPETKYDAYKLIQAITKDKNS